MPYMALGRGGGGFGSRGSRFQAGCQVVYLLLVWVFNLCNSYMSPVIWRLKLLVEVISCEQVTAW